MTTDLSDLLTDYHFDLPPELIAQSPAPERDQARLLVVRRHRLAGQKLFEDLKMSELPNFVASEPALARALWARNRTRVLPARFYVTRPTGGRHEIVLLKESAEKGIWKALIRGQSHFKYPQPLKAEAEAPDDLWLSSPAPGLIDLRTISPEGPISWLNRVGQMPLPPYIEDRNETRDRERYQSIWADPQKTFSAAAPTASLHFTTEIVRALEVEQNVRFIDLRLHVGLGTFEPVREKNLSKHELHLERMELSGFSASVLERAEEEKIPVLSVGTTALRAVESFSRRNDKSNPTVRLRQNASGDWTGSTSLFVRPGFEFRQCQYLLTNFHLPESTLFVLVAVFCGSRHLAKEAYQHAIEKGYRFFSYGDATLWI